MIASRWAAASTLAVALLLAGCQPSEPAPAPASGMMPSADKVAAAKAKYSEKGDMLVGVVEAANERFAAVGGIDAKSVKKDDVLHFVDVDSNQIVCQGTLHDVGASGSVIIDYDKTGGTRAPRQGDLVLKAK